MKRQIPHRLRLVFITVLSIVTVGGAQPAQASDNTILGTGAGFNLTANAHDNTLLGVKAGRAIKIGDSNTLVGNQAGRFTTEDFNTMVGDLAGRNTTTGAINAFFGASAGVANTTGTFNTYLGATAGFNNQTGSENVFVGFGAGQNELGSNKLYIAITDDTPPLIYGEFDNALVGINGALGVGTEIPLDKLHVRDGNLRIEQTGATDAILHILTNNKEWEITNNQVTGRLTFFAPGGGASTGSFKFDPQAVENLLRIGITAANTVDINGNLVVTGSINPDYVFTPEYALESIEAHAAYMWEHRHLPAVGVGQVNAQGQGMVNVGARSQGMLEELEKAHIYIEQLHGEMEALKGESDHKGKQIAGLTQEVTELKGNEAQLEALKDEMTVKKGQLNALQGEVTALKALMNQLMIQERASVPEKEG